MSAKTPKTESEWLDVIARELGLWPPPSEQELKLFVGESFPGARIDIRSLHDRLFNKEK